jgi:hypothetical protein
MAQSMGMRIAAEVGEAMLAKRLKREAEEQKAGKGPKMEPGKFGKTPDTFNRGSSEAAYQAQRAGERMDFGGPRATPSDMPTPEVPTSGYPEVPTDQMQSYDSLMAPSMMGSGKFTKAELARGYRVLKAPKTRRGGR